MASDRLPTVRVNFYDGQRVTEQDLDSEQIYNRTVTSDIVKDFHGSGIYTDTPYGKTPLLDTSSPSDDNPTHDLIEGQFDGHIVYLDKNVSDPIRGSRIVVELSDSLSLGRDVVKVIILGKAFNGVGQPGNLFADYIEFSGVGKKVSSVYFTDVIAVFVNGITGCEGMTEFGSAEVKGLGGKLVFREAESLEVFAASEMIQQVQSPNFELAGFTTYSNAVTITDLFSLALGVENDIGDLYLDFNFQTVDFNANASTAISYGQKFLAKSNNIQKVDLLMSADGVWTGDLVLSVYKLSTDINCPTDAVPSDMLGYDPEISPLLEVSVNYGDLETLGVVLDSSPQIVSFNFADTLIADPNIDPSIVKNKYYAIVLTRRGSNSSGKVSLYKGESIKAGKVNAGVALTIAEEYSKDVDRYFEFDPSTNRYVNDTDSALWYIVHTDAVEVTHGIAYVDGIAVVLPKTRSFVGETEISFFANNISLANISGSENYIVVDHVNEFIAPGVHPRTGNFVHKMIQDSMSLRAVDAANVEDSLVIAKVVDRNTRFAQSVVGTFNKPGFIGSDYALIMDPGNNLVADNLVGRHFIPDTDCGCSDVYKIVGVECVSEMSGDLDGDGELTSADIVRMLSLTGNTINSADTIRKINSGDISVIDFIKSDLNVDGTIDGVDIELLEDAISGSINFVAPLRFRYLKLKLENIFASDDYPEIFNGVGDILVGTNEVNLVMTATEALVVRSGDIVQVSGINAGSYIVDSKSIAVNGTDVVLSVIDFTGAEPSFSAEAGIGIVVISGTEVNMLADNHDLVLNSATNYQIKFVSEPFNSDFIEVCDLRRFVEATFVEDVNSVCICVDSGLCPKGLDCGRLVKNQKYLPGDLYIEGDILSAPGVPYHGDFEYTSVKVTVPPGTIDGCSIDLYNTFIKSEAGTCDTKAGYPAMRYSDGTFVGCDDAGGVTDIDRGRVKFSHAIASMFVDAAINDGYQDGYADLGDVTYDNTGSVEAIHDSYVGVEYSTYDTWELDAGNNTVITDITTPSGPNEPAVFDLVTTSDSAERFGRLNIPVADRDFNGDFIVDFTAARMNWVNTIVGTVSAFASMLIENVDGSTALLKLGWKTGTVNQIFYSGVIRNSLNVIISTFEFTSTAPDGIGKNVRFRLRRINDVVSAYYVTEDGVYVGDGTSFGDYIRLGTNPDVQPGDGEVKSFSFEIAQVNSPATGDAYSVKLSYVNVNSSLISDVDPSVLLIGGSGTGNYDRVTLTFPVDIPRRTQLIAAEIEFTSAVTGIYNNDLYIVPLYILNSSNLGEHYNVPTVLNGTYIKSFAPGNVVAGDKVRVDVRTIVSGFILAAGHLPGQLKGFVFESGENNFETFAATNDVTLYISYIDSSTGVVFKVGIYLDVNTGVATLNTKNILYDDLNSANRTVIDFGIYLKKSGFRNKDITVGISELSKIGIGPCFDATSVGDNEDYCYFITGSTNVGTLVEGPFACEYLAVGGGSALPPIGGECAEEVAYAYSQGFDVGEDYGYGIGYGVGFGEGEVEGYAEGEVVGYGVGYGDGYSEGEIAGYAEGYPIGYDAGEVVGYGVGFSDGYEEGEVAGYNVGYPEGFDAGEIVGYGVGFGDGYQEGLVDGILYGTEAERARAMGWQFAGMPGVVDGLVFSDPAGLLSSYNVDPVTGIFTMTALPGIQTAEPDLFAGWEGKLLDGQMQDFGILGQNIVSRLIRDNLVILNSVDLEVVVMFMNGPRSTATLGFGGGYAATASVSGTGARVKAYALNGTFNSVVSGGTNSNSAQVQLVNNGINFTSHTRFINPIDGTLNGTAVFGAQANNGNVSDLSGWNETYIFIGIGRVVGDNVAPNNVPETVSLQPIFAYVAPDVGKVVI